MTKEGLNSSWVLWYHYDINIWTQSSFRKIAKIETVEDFWIMVDMLKDNQVMIEHIFFMREGIYPVWEDPNNRSGGCWSLKIDIKDSYTTLVKILMYVIGENILFKGDENISEELTGVSLCQKNNYNCVLQLWTSNNKNNKINYLQKAITDQYGFEIIYRPHIVDST